MTESLDGFINEEMSGASNAKERSHYVSFTCPPELRVRLEAVARRLGSRKRSKVITACLRDGLERMEQALDERDQRMGNSPHPE